MSLFSLRKESFTTALVNMPGVVPRTSAIVSTNVAMRYGLQIEQAGLEKACEDAGVKSGVNCYLGELTNKNVATAHGYKHVDLDEIF